MSKTERELLVTWWREAWTDGLWAASWSGSLAGLSAQQAAWAPELGGTRHSIWQHVLHMVFWREKGLRRVMTGVKVSDEEKNTGNFPVIPEVTETAWADAQRRLLESHDRIGAAFADPAFEIEWLKYILPHDCYHFGQINLLRAMQGLKPIE